MKLVIMLLALVASAIAVDPRLARTSSVMPLEDPGTHHCILHYEYKLILF